MPSPNASADPAPLSKQIDRVEEPSRVGPLLYFRGCEEGRLELAALLVHPDQLDAPIVTAEETTLAAEVLHRRNGLAVLRYEFSLPAVTGGSYTVAGEQFDVAGIPDDGLRLAYVSCNGQESGDRDRPPAERNTLWRRLVQQHTAEPLSLLLHGGDQLYADEMLDVHPSLREWREGSTADAAALPLPASVPEQLRNYLLTSYMKLYSQPATAWLLARVPSLCMWDDHDICDGWGSLSAERMESPIGRAIFEAAREFFLLFQLGCTREALPSICLDRTGATLTWMVTLPGTHLIAPDLRSERRPQRILGVAGWAAMEKCLAASKPADVTDPVSTSSVSTNPVSTTAGSPDPGSEPGHVFILSSVPVMGPRLSWVEAVLHLVAGAQKYEDDLRDQWQSRAHREEWQRLLRDILDVHDRDGSPVTVLSGEIHLATRCTMAARGGPVQQLIASGITHPAPSRWYARILGGLARFGEAPLSEHPIRLHPLPGQRGIYTAERNYLVLQRRAGRWTAWWELEHSGPTPPLELSRAAPVGCVADAQGSGRQVPNPQIPATDGG